MRDSELRGRAHALPAFATFTLLGVALGRRSKRDHQGHRAAPAFLTVTPDDEFTELGCRPPTAADGPILRPKVPHQRSA